MKHKLAYSPSDSKQNNDHLSFKARSPIKAGLFESTHQPQNTAFRESQAYTPPNNDFNHVKRIPDSTDFMRHTMNSELAKRLGNVNWDEEPEKPSKMDYFLRQTMSYKSTARNSKNFHDDPSKEIQLKPDSSESTIHYNHILSDDSVATIRSGRNLLEGSRSIKDYQKLSEKIDRNKKMIDQLRKTAKYEKDFLKNVNHSKSPAYIDLDSQKYPVAIAFRKSKKEVPSFLTPQANKDLGVSRFKSSPQIDASKSAQKKVEEIPASPQTTMPGPKKKFSPFSSPKAHCTLEDFELGKKLGEGKFGVVNVARHKLDGGLYALKKIPKAMIKSHMMVDQLSLELRIQSCMNQRNILGMYGFFDDKTHLYIVLEYMDGGTLYEKLKKTTKLTEHETASIIRQITEAIDYLHDRGVAHRDLKPENIVISNNVHKLCDFGWAAMCNERRKTYCGTFDYVAPEILEGVDYDMTVDLWCLGVMTFQLMTGKAPFYHISRKETMKKILNVENDNLVFPESMSELAKDFIEKLVRKNPNERIKASDALNHPFLKAVEAQL